MNTILPLFVTDMAFKELSFDRAVPIIEGLWAPVPFVLTNDSF